MKNINKLIRRIWSVSGIPVALMLTSSVIMADCMPVYAETFATISIPATCIIADGIPKERRDFTYELRAKSNSDPMPAGSSAGIRTVHKSRSGLINFGNIRFDHPDIYFYTLKETSREWGRFKRDHNVYTAQVIVESGKDVKVVFKNRKGEKTDRAEFINTYKIGERKKRNTPKMGDSIYELAAAVTAAFVASALLIFLVKRRSRNEE